MVICSVKRYFAELLLCARGQSVNKQAQSPFNGELEYSVIHAAIGEAEGTQRPESRKVQQADI